jgi:hypothetical protein
MTTPNFGIADIWTLRHAPVSSTVWTLCLCWTARSYVRSVSKPGTSSSRNCPIRVVVGIVLYRVKIKASRAFATFLSEVLR